MQQLKITRLSAFEQQLIVPEIDQDFEKKIDHKRPQNYNTTALVCICGIRIRLHYVLVLLVLATLWGSIFRCVLACILLMIIAG